MSARDMYRAFASGDRAAVERCLADDFSFSSPLDVGLDRAGEWDGRRRLTAAP
jgi:ketosteroid isomerase-like protein